MHNALFFTYFTLLYLRKDYSGYSMERMKQFLQRTKGMRNVEVIDFFPDLSLFIDSAKILMKQKGEVSLSNPEVYRLKKIGASSDNT